MSSPQDRPIVVIGAGLAGWTTVRELRKLDSQVPVTLVTLDAGDFYAKPSLSNAFAQKRSPAQLLSMTAAKMVETTQVQLLAHTRVERIDTDTQAIHTNCNGETGFLHYRDLVLATGANPIRVPVAGSAADRVLSVNSLDDFSTFFSALSQDSALAGSSENNSKTVLIMGAGLIGCEFANDLVLGGHQVHVVDPATRPLSLLVPPASGEQLRGALADLGVQWHFGTTLQSLERGQGGAYTATLADGSLLLVDTVLSAIGLRANTALASAAGLACERGIRVDTLLRTSAAHVYALGDCAQYASAGERALPYVMPIMNAAKALASTLAGTSTELVFPLMPVSVKTPALPMVVCAAHPALEGAWHAVDLADPGTWHFRDTTGSQRGFTLTGKHTAKRMELVTGTVL